MTNFWTAFVMYGGPGIGILAFMIGSMAIKERRIKREPKARS